jgi:hypothetical protein
MISERSKQASGQFLLTLWRYVLAKTTTTPEIGSKLLELYFYDTIASIWHLRALCPVLPQTPHRRSFVSDLRFRPPFRRLSSCSCISTCVWPYKSCPWPIVRFPPSRRRFLLACRRWLSVSFSCRRIWFSDLRKAIWCMIPRVGTTTSTPLWTKVSGCTIF